ncbi:MAG: BON domain-containing protein [Candidatus Omnitrophica bacterium]|nr:BON domain-containing protein [Candidatus Omnitrophota bacterium]
MRNPQETLQHVREQLQWDSRIDASHITVELDDGSLVLKGTVPTFSMADAAETAAWTAAPDAENIVNKIKAKHLPAENAVSDDQIQKTIENILRWNPRIDPSFLEIECAKGQVTLKGTIDSYWQKQRAEELIGEVSGVVQITNNLSVQPKSRVEDKLIYEDILAAFRRDRRLNSSRIIVTVEDAKVALTGAVPDRDRMRIAKNIAVYTRGVKEVENNLRVEHPKA